MIFFVWKKPQVSWVCHGEAHLWGHRLFRASVQLDKLDKHKSYAPPWDPLNSRKMAKETWSSGPQQWGVCNYSSNFHGGLINHHYSTRSTQKSPVRHKDTPFDTKMPSSACISWHCHYQACEKYFFQFYINILLLRTHREMKMKLYWYEFKYIQPRISPWIKSCWISLFTCLCHNCRIIMLCSIDCDVIPRT